MILSSLQAKSATSLSEVRGMGLMIGIELKQPCGELVLQGLQAGLVFNVTADNVIRLLPPLVMSERRAPGRRAAGPPRQGVPDKRAAA